MARQSPRHRCFDSSKAPLQRSQACWAGHIRYMQDIRIPKQLLFGVLANGTKSLGGQRKRVKDTLKSPLKALGIGTETWEDLAKGCTALRRAILLGALKSDNNCLDDSRRKRMNPKTRAGSAGISKLKLVDKPSSHPQNPVDLSFLMSWSSW